MKHLKINILFSLIILTLAISSCDKDEPIVTPEIGYLETVIPSTITDLYTSIGDAASDTVWVYLQGGPVKEFPELSLEEDEYTWFADDLKVYPRQAQNINTTIAEEDDFIFENAKKENEISAQIVNEVVSHFKNQGKVVYVIGHSYGAFVAQEVLRLYGPIAAHTMILNGRINMDTDVWTGFSKGESWEFDEMGLNPTFDSNNEGEVEVQNMSMMAAGAGHRRYTQDLSSVDLSTVSFVSAQFDEAVGRYSAEELLFAEQNASLGVTFPEFGHGDVFNPEIMKLLHDHMISDGEDMEGFHPNGIKILTDKTPQELTASMYTIDSGASMPLGSFEISQIEGFDDPFFVLNDGGTIFLVAVDENFEIKGDLLLYSEDGGDNFFTTDNFTFAESTIGYLLSGTVANDQGETKMFTLDLSENQFGEGTSTITVNGSQAMINGTLGSKTYNQILDLNANYPDVNTILT